MKKNRQYLPRMEAIEDSQWHRDVGYQNPLEKRIVRRYSEMKMQSSKPLCYQCQNLRLMP